MSTKILSMTNIYKSFGTLNILKGVTLNLYQGEVLALMGENGAGKSTLMKILAGIESQDQGEITLFDHLYHANTIHSSESQGIIMIHQELNLFDDLNVLDNVFLGAELIKNRFQIDYQRELQELEQLFKQLNININPYAYVGDLSIGQKQLIEIIKALRKNAKILIMDEPTSALSEEEIKHVFSIIDILKKKHVSIIYISHRMQEIYDICDRAMILRDGTFIGEYVLSELPEEQLISLMVGRDISDPFPYLAVDRKEKILSIKNLQGEFIKEINFDLYRGEILGIGGLMGSGRTSLAHTLCGLLPIHSGEIFLDNQSIQLSHPSDALGYQIIYISEDRKYDGLWLNFSIKENISMTSLNLFTNKIGAINAQQEYSLVLEFMNLTKIKAMNANTIVNTLSGGNQQKVAIARALLTGPRILILDEPTRGIDIGARREIYALINELKQKGTAIILISSDMPELLSLSDRVLVMSEGKMTGILGFEEKNPDNIMKLAVN